MPLSVAGDGVELVHERVRKAILGGEMAPELELSQVQLARQLGVSRTVLREALRMLQREGLIDARPNRLVRVAGLSVADMEQLYIARVTLEAAAIRISAPLLDVEALADLEGELARMAHYAEEKDYERWEQPHRRFHAGLVGASGIRLRRMLDELSDHAERYRRFYTVTQQPSGWITGIGEHRAILDASKARSPDAAAKALATHLAHTAFGVILRVDPEYEPAALRLTLAGLGIEPEIVRAEAS